MGGKKVYRYPVIIEKSAKNYSAYSPDLPGCVATGATIKETLARMRTAIKFHLEGLKKEGCDIIEPSTRIKYLEISV
jgi:predicted RNase H-like HicB family nuclease